MNTDVNKPVENPVLKALLSDYAAKDNTGKAAAAEAIAEELAEHAAVLAVIRPGEDGIADNGDGTAVFWQDSTVSFEMFRDADGTDYLPVFTDWDELKKNDRYRDMHVHALIITFDDISAITAGKAGAVINPFSDNFIITPQNVIHMKQHKDIVTKGYSAQVVEKDTTVQIGDPADVPEEMIEAIRRYAKTDRTIKAIWLKLMIKDGEKSWLLIVDFSGDKDKVFSSIARAATPHLRSGMFIDMVPLTDRFGQSAASGEPIYKRKRRLFR